MQMAHEKSKRISTMVKGYWEKQASNASKGKIHSKKLPSWIRYNEKKEKLELIPENAKAIKHIFKRTIEGIGQVQLCREMNEKFQPFTKRKNNDNPKWNKSYISKILRDKSTYGLFQPYRFDENHERVPNGPPIKDYFPAAITEDDFNQAQFEKQQRKKEKYNSTTFVNLLEGLVLNADDNSICHVTASRTKRKNGDTYIQRRLTSYKHISGLKNACKASVNYFALEALVIQALSQLTDKELKKSDNPKAQQIHLEKAIAGLKLRIKETEYELAIAKLPKQISVLAELLDEQEHQLKQNLQRLSILSGIKDDDTVPANPFINILHNMEKMNHDQQIDFLKKLKPKIQSIVKQILILPIKLSNRRVFFIARLELSSGENQLLLGAPSPLKEKENLLFIDNDNNPLGLVTYHGLIFYNLERLSEVPKNEQEGRTIFWNQEEQHIPTPLPNPRASFRSIFIGAVKRLELTPAELATKISSIQSASDKS
jgi:hypothetical protein